LKLKLGSGSWKRGNMFSVLSLLSSDEAEIDIVKEDLCEHVMLHVEGRVPQGCPGYWTDWLNDGFVWRVMAFGRYRR
jgi:hypothetical protein